MCIGQRWEVFLVGLEGVLVIFCGYIDLQQLFQLYRPVTSYTAVYTVISRFAMVTPAHMLQGIMVDLHIAGFEY